MGGVATVPRRLETGPDTQLDVLRYRFAACTVGSAITLPGIYFTYITFTTDFAAVPMGPLLLTFGLLLLAMGTTCCVLAIRRGEPAVPGTRYTRDLPMNVYRTRTMTCVWHTETRIETEITAPPVSARGTNQPIQPPPYSEVVAQGAPPSYWGVVSDAPPAYNASQSST